MGSYDVFARVLCRLLQRTSCPLQVSWAWCVGISLSARPAVEGVSNTGWLAGSDPLVPLQNSEWTPLGPTFWIGMDPFGNFVGPNSKNHPKWALFFSWFGRPFLWLSTKHQSLKRRKTYKTPYGRQKMHVVKSMVM